MGKLFASPLQLFCLIQSNFAVNSALSRRVSYRLPVVPSSIHCLGFASARIAPCISQCFLYPKHSRV